jgi:hypothetical protein
VWYISLIDGVMVMQCSMNSKLIFSPPGKIIIKGDKR